MKKVEREERRSQGRGAREFRMNKAQKARLAFSSVMPSVCGVEAENTLNIQGCTSNALNQSAIHGTDTPPPGAEREKKEMEDVGVTKRRRKSEKRLDNEEF